MSETFWDSVTGTRAPGSLDYLALIPQLNTDTVVLDGFLFEMTREITSGTVALFQPASASYDPDGGWNMSFEVTRPNEDSAYIASNLTSLAGRQSLCVYLMDSGPDVLAAVELIAGSPSNESIRVLSGLNWTSWPVADDLLPPLPNESDFFGHKPDRYLVSFEFVFGFDRVNITIINTGRGVVWSGTVDTPPPDLKDPPGLRFDIDVQTGDYGLYNLASGWMIDNLLLRSSPSRYAIIGPAYEYVTKDEPVWVSVVGVDGAIVANATVSVEGIPAEFNSQSGRYEAYLQRIVDWDVPLRCSVDVDGITVNDTIKVTTSSENQGPLSVSYWWNGLDWASVLGRDDAYYVTSGDDAYVGYSHPTTSYIISGFNGNSTSLLVRQSEVAYHLPHDYLAWGRKNWSESLIDAEFARAKMESEYWFASRWDDPRYVGEGDTYLSVGTPGNWASWEQMYAYYVYGSRLMGTSSQAAIAGNSSLIGSYMILGNGVTTIPTWASWHPSSKMDLMDMFRAVSIDSGQVSPGRWSTANAIAQGNGVLRVYNHGTIGDASFLRWLCDDKSNSTLENWKATDGEVASYIYGRWSTDVSLNGSCGVSSWNFNVSRRDPHESGYWNVPVTLAFDMSEKKLIDVQIPTDGQVLSSANGTLPYLNGSRIMDVGYDLRDDTLYISHFWNESSTLTVYAEALTHPRILSEPDEDAIVLDDYLAELLSTPADNGDISWNMSTDATWLGMELINSTACVLHGIPLVSGIFWVNVTVRDENSSSSLNWTITAQRLKILSGHIYGYDGEVLADFLVTVTTSQDGIVRALHNVSTNATGFYEVTFLECEWSPGDMLTVSATIDGVARDKSVKATELPYQTLDVWLYNVPGDNTFLTLLLGVYFTGLAVLVVVFVRQLRKA